MLKYACVTGADRGLGFELTKKLLENGFTVFAGQFQEKSEKLDLLLQDYPAKLYLIPLNVTDSDSIRKAKSVISEVTGYLDLLINNAAILGDIEATIADKIDFDQILNVINVNALGALRVSNAFYELICKSEQKLIVNISSEAGSISTCERKSWFGYTMSKSTLNMGSAVIHNLLKQMGGQVILFHPGWMQTHMRGHFDAGAPLTPEQSAAKIIHYVLNQVNKPGDLPVFVDYEGHSMPW